jgi:hypothetical protein
VTGIETVWLKDRIDPRIIEPWAVNSETGERIEKITWAPQPGSQDIFLKMPNEVIEVLYEGTRGPGKTDALLMDFTQEVGKGFGEDWKGVIFRKTYPELQDIIDKSKKWFWRMFPGAKYNEQKSWWVFPDGEKLMFRPFSRKEDYWSFHGHAYPFIGWEELTNWADSSCYKVMFSCSRSTRPGMPRKIRATCNPYGIGHNWVKNRFELPVRNNHRTTRLINDKTDEDGRPEPTRIAVHGFLRENIILMTADPEYVNRIAAAARNEAEKRAWLEGDWDITAGGMFDDIWYNCKQYSVVDPFEVPSSWKIDRSFDWGSSKPFSVGWWAESDGSDLRLANGQVRSTVRGDLFRIAEWYGCGKNDNEGLKLLATEISKGIVERELKWGIRDRVRPGPADSSIFDEENGNCISDDMLQEVTIGGVKYKGIKWKRADKSPGSRKQGWEQIRKMLQNTIPNGAPRENPGLFVVSTCKDFLRTVPSLPRDDKDLDDVDTDAEDHIGDEVRYRVRFERKEAKSGKTRGMY